MHCEGERQKTPLARAATWFAGTSKNENVEPYFKKWLTLSRWWQQSMKPIQGLAQHRERGWCDWACQTDGVIPVEGYFRVGVCKWVWILCAVERSPKISAPSSPPESHMCSCIWQRFTERYAEHASGAWGACMQAESPRSCPTLCDPVDCSPPGSTCLSMGFSQQKYWSGLPFPSPGDLPHPGIKSVSLTSPTLAGGFFTTSTTWEAPTLGRARWIS